MMILITGFESYGGRSTNPAEAVARALDGAAILGVRVRGQILPVDFDAVSKLMPEMIDAFEPRIVLSLGLWPGETMIRIERVAANWSVFELPDNAGYRQIGAVIQGGPDAYLSKLPADKMQAALRQAGIPARQSGSAGTYLCNATSYLTAHHCARHKPNTGIGFIHLPYLPEQVAQLLDQIEADSVLETHQRADFASMSLEMMVDAVTIGLQAVVRDMTEEGAPVGVLV